MKYSLSLDYQEHKENTITPKGTMVFLADEIKELFPKAIICEEASKANVRGFLRAITE